MAAHETMPLHPTIAALLNEIAHLPRVFEVPVEVARQAFRKRIERLPPVTDPLGSVEDLRLLDGDRHIPARLYKPVGEGTFPLILFLHGGGFVLGDLDTHDRLCRRLCARTRCAMLAVDYRLAPEHPFPAAFDDCWAALRWAVCHASAIGVDASRIALAGDSAGGALAAAVSMRCRDQGGPAIRAQVLIYPLLDHYSAETRSYSEMAEGYGLSRDATIWFIDQYLPDPSNRLNPYALPLRAKNHAGLPPTYVVTAEYDVLRDEGERYAALLNAAGVETRITRYAGMNHGFIALSGIVEQADQAIDGVCEWLKARLIDHSR